MNTTRTSATARRIALVGALPLAAVLALAGCASNDDDRTDAGGAPAAGASSSATTPATGGSATAARSSAADGEALRAAVATARDAVGAGTVVSVEQEAGGSAWEVLVVDADGGEHEVHTDAAGERVTSGPTVDATDADDVAENKRFVGAADLDVTEAATKLTDAVAGTVTELGLDDHLGEVVWEGDVRDAAGTKHSVRIDAGSGKVVTNTVDTDD